LTEMVSPQKHLLEEVKEWASHLSAETRGSSWVDDGYVMVDEVSRLCSKLLREEGGLYALIGCQGVGKTSAILAITSNLRRSAPRTEPHLAHLLVLPLKWRRLNELFSQIIWREDILGSMLRCTYSDLLEDAVENRKPDRRIMFEKGIREYRAEMMKLNEHHVSIIETLSSYDLIQLEKKLGKAFVEQLRYESLLRVLGEFETILIDLPDYSKTDMRRLASDLEALYWIWARLSGSRKKTNIVISFQKEMFHGHFFLNKMYQIELKPLKPEKLVEAYKKRFPNAKAFTEHALLLIAKMSRGVFRRFLRYITLAINHQEQAGASFPITVDQVREAVPVQVLAEDMDQQLAEIFPRQPDLRTEAVKLLLYLEEHGPTSQTKITELLELHNYTVSRLLNKLEDHHYVRRERQGIENVISLVQP